MVTSELFKELSKSCFGIFESELFDPRWIEISLDIRKSFMLASSRKANISSDSHLFQGLHLRYLLGVICLIFSSVASFFSYL